MSSSLLSLPGEAGDYASTPDAAALDITGDLEIIARIAMDDWSPSNDNIIAAKWVLSGNKRSYMFGVVSTDKFQFWWSEDGSAVKNKKSNVGHGISSGIQWVRVTLDVDDGSSDIALKYYLGGSGVTPSWVQLGETQTLGAASSIFSGSADLEIGSRNGNAEAFFAGKMYNVQILDGIGGTVVFDSDFTAEAPGTTSFTESSAQAATVTINQSGSPQAEIVTDVTVAEYQNARRRAFRRF